MSTQTSLKKTKIFHPFLVAIFPVMVIYSENIGKVEFHELILPIVLTLVFSFSLFFILKIILKNPFKAGVIVTLTLILLFSYGHLYYLLNDFSIFDFDIGRNRYLIPLFGIIFSISVFFTIKTKRLLNNATSILNVVSIVFLIVACSNLFLLAADFSTCEKCAVEELFYETKDYSNYFTPHTFQINENQNLPNVYYLILDEYPRNDALLDYHDFNNDDFKNFLESKGFHVASNSFSNYPMSILSIPATMNMNYVNFLADEIGSETRNFKPLNEKDYGLYPNNMVIKNFKEMNYKIITFNSFSLHLHENPLSDQTFCHRDKFVMDNRLVDALSRISIFGYYVERWAEAELRQVTLCTLEKFSESYTVFDEPTFVWGHVMLPHPPWIWGPNGEEITPGKPLLITDNPEFRDAGWEPKQQFIQQVQFANKKTIEIVNKILDNDPYSIIIIQGDHGTAWDLDWDNPSTDDAWQRLRNFSAIYFPDSEKRSQLSDDITLVNTFRIVFNTYFGSDYEILEDKMYWGKNHRPFNFIDVTDFVLNR